jgi:hypothetical protein
MQAVENSIVSAVKTPTFSLVQKSLIDFAFANGF